MKKVVLLAPYFLPRRRVGAWRPFKFAIHLKTFGWEPHIITIKASGSVTAKEHALLDKLPIYSIASPFDFTDRSGSSLNGASLEKLNNAKEKGEIHSFLKWVDRHFPIDTWLPLFYYRKNRVKRMVSEIGPDLLWSTGDPWSVHWLGYQITKKINMPWVADFRDPWTLGSMNLKERSAFSSKIDKYYERKIIKKADLLTFTARATETLYRDYYNQYEPSTDTIYNSFDSGLYNLDEPNKDPFDPLFLNLIFFGSFRTLSPAEHFIGLLEKLRGIDKDAAGKVRMYSFGRLGKKDKAKAKRSGVADQFKQLKPTPPEDALSILTKADILWLSTHPDRKYIVPAKLWDYLAATKPVLSIAPNPEIAHILEETQTGQQFGESNIDQLVDLLLRCVKAKQQGASIPILFNPDQKKITGYDASRSTRKLAQLFDGLV